MSPTDDRAAVLRRRALFLGSTLAALGSCQKGGVPAETAQGPVVAVPEGEAEDAGVDPDAATLPTREAGPRPRGNLPSLEIPAGISETARSNYENLVARMTRAHGVLDEIESMAPKCSMTACEDKWALVAKKLFELEDSFGFFYGCEGSSEQAKAFAVRQKEHMDFYQARRKDVETWLTGLLGEQGWARLQELLEQERFANPRPCLSIACMDW
ncbi:MAG: hypothetical protein DYH12_21735 [Sorangiineae bacterium PRO1]|nr:hypothetical protein [Sorangiineae bacterium PRO1]